MAERDQAVVSLATWAEGRLAAVAPEAASCVSTHPPFGSRAGSAGTPVRSGNCGEGLGSPVRHQLEADTQ